VDVGGGGDGGGGVRGAASAAGGQREDDKNGAATSYSAEGKLQSAAREFCPQDVSGYEKQENAGREDQARRQSGKLATGDVNESRGRA
jgi:hypothetical protein